MSLSLNNYINSLFHTFNKSQSYKKKELGNECMSSFSVRIIPAEVNFRLFAWFRRCSSRSSKLNFQRRVSAGVSEQVLLLCSRTFCMRAEQQESERAGAGALFAAVAKFIHTAALAIYYAAFTARGLIIKRERFRPPRTDCRRYVYK